VGFPRGGFSVKRPWWQSRWSKNKGKCALEDVVYVLQVKCKVLRIAIKELTIITEDMKCYVQPILLPSLGVIN
jgi:hypothetical protein